MNDYARKIKYLEEESSIVDFKKINTSLQEISDDQASIDFIANLGFYSLLYDTPQIFSSPFQLIHKNQAFTKYIKEQIQENSLDISTLCGLGFGLLNMEGGIS